MKSLVLGTFVDVTDGKFCSNVTMKGQRWQDVCRRFKLCLGSCGLLMSERLLSFSEHSNEKNEVSTEPNKSVNGHDTVADLSIHLGASYYYYFLLLS